MISLIISGLGAILAAVGGGVLLARCFRQPRGDLIAWAVALLGLLISLGSQVLGYLTGFDAAMFRAMELGGQVIAPMALILALSEVAATSAAARFCARLYIPALGIVAAVILSMDQLAQTSFTKAWPDPSVFYQVPPDYVLMFAIGPLTTLITIIAVGTVVVRSGQPGWNAVLPAELMGGAAAVALAYPCLAQLIAYLSGIHLPVGSVFPLLCVAAVVLGWLAADRAGRVRLSALHGGSAAEASGWGASDGYGNRDRDGEFGRFATDSEYADRNGYRSGGPYRPEQPGSVDAPGWRGEHDADGYGWQDDRPDRREDGSWRSRDDADPEHWDGYPALDATGDFVPGDFGATDSAAGDYATGDFVTGDFMAGSSPAADPLVGDHDLGYRGDDWRPDSRRQEEYAGGPDGIPAAPRRAAGDAGTAQFFGQIAIYTLIEDRVEEFDQLTERVVEQVRSREPDTLAFIVHAVPSAPMQRILYEVYRDRTAYERHNEQPYVQQFAVDRRPFVLATNIIELGLQQAKVSPFPSVADLFGEPGYDTSGFERPDFLRDYGRTSGQAGTSRREYR
ncbi:MAG TPA: antibiotic biosynthesis monooxygenase [Streptosporangiaceae bacterium]|nr:antibiotic biosynthesis monooxygenase [Streptosporangiaceae bacterium]